MADTEEIKRAIKMYPLQQKNKHFEDLNKEDTKIYNLSEMENLASSNDKNMPSFSWKCKILRGSHFIFE